MDNKNQADLAAAKDYTKSFALTLVKIRAVDLVNNQITFMAKGSTSLYTARWTDPDVWIGCPTTIDSSPGKLPDVDTQGRLLVGASIFNDPSFAPARPFTPGLKWPIEGSLFATPFESRADSVTGYSPLTLSAASIDITAAVPAQSYRLEFELLAQDCRNDALDLSGFSTILNIMTKKSGQCTPTELQILHAVVHGKNLETGIADKVDLMDPMLSDPFQIVDLTGRPNISVLLSQRGLARFGAGDLPERAAR
jgi:hypothetical protein